jgi:hypothetical protein
LLRLTILKYTIRGIKSTGYNPEGRPNESVAQDRSGPFLAHFILEKLIIANATLACSNEEPSWSCQ